MKNEIVNNKKYHNNNILLYNIKETEDDKIIEDSNYSASKINNNFTDLLSSSSSFERIFNNPFLFEERSSDIDFNNIKNYVDINEKKRENITSINLKDNNNIFRHISERGKSSSLIKTNSKKPILKLGEENKKDIFNNKTKNKKVINIFENSNSQKSLKLESNIINKISYEFNKEKNHLYFSDINKELNKSKSTNELKSNSFYIYNNSELSSKNKNSNNSKNDNYKVSSYSSSNIKDRNNQHEKEKNSINNTHEKILPNINNIIIGKKKNDIENEIYKFSFKIIPKNQNKINIKIELGFEITFTDESIWDKNSEEESVDSSQDIITFSNTYQKYYIKKFDKFLLIILNNI